MQSCAREAKRTKKLKLFRAMFRNMFHRIQPLVQYHYDNQIPAEMIIQAYVHTAVLDVECHRVFLNYGAS